MTCSVLILLLLEFSIKHLMKLSVKLSKKPEGPEVDKGLGL